MGVKHAEGWPIMNIMNLHQDGNQQCLQRRFHLFFFPSLRAFMGFVFRAFTSWTFVALEDAHVMVPELTASPGASLQNQQKQPLFCGDSSNLKTFQFGVVNVPQLFFLIFHDFVWCRFSTLFCFIFIMATIKINSSGVHNIICFIKTNSFARNSLFSYFSSI